MSPCLPLLTFSEVVSPEEMQHACTEQTWWTSTDDLQSLLYKKDWTMPPIHWIKQVKTLHLRATTICLDNCFSNCEQQVKLWTIREFQNMCKKNLSCKLPTFRINLGKTMLRLNTIEHWHTWTACVATTCCTHRYKQHQTFSPFFNWIHRGQSPLVLKRFWSSESLWPKFRIVQSIIIQSSKQCPFILLANLRHSFEDS